MLELKCNLGRRVAGQRVDEAELPDGLVQQLLDSGGAVRVGPVDAADPVGGLIDEIDRILADLALALETGPAILFALDESAADAARAQLQDVLNSYRLQTAVQALFPAVIVPDTVDAIVQRETALDARVADLDARAADLDAREQAFATSGAQLDAREQALAAREAAPANATSNNPPPETEASGDAGGDSSPPVDPGASAQPAGNDAGAAGGDAEKAKAETRPTPRKARK